MKQFLFFCLLASFHSFNSAAQSRYWVGVSGSNWTNGTNWSLTSGGGGGAGAPTSVQDVIFDNSFSGTVSYDAGTITVNSLTITSSSNVILSLAGATGRTLTCNNGGAVTNAFFIQSGSTLTMTTATNSINFTLGFASNSKGQIDGTYITAGAIVGGSGGRIDATSSILTINGIYRMNTGSSNFTGATLANTTFSSGSTYEINKDGGSFPTATWNTGSLARHTGMISGAPVFLGSTYADLEWNCASQTNVMTLSANLNFNNINLINTGTAAFRLKGGASVVTYTLVINGSLTVSANSILETTGSTTTAGSGVIQAKGDIVNDGIIRENSSGLVNNFALTGSSNQNISGSGTWTGNDFTFVMNNASGATLLSPLSLPYNLELTSGKITTTAVNLLTMVDNATYTGGSTTSFVNGPMKKIGDDNFSFPIGTGSIYAPIGIANVSGETITDEFRAEYIRSNPQAVHGTAVQSGQDHVSLVEYWTLSHSGAATKQISLAINYTSFCFDLSKTYVSRWDGAGPFWTNQGSTFVSGPSAPPLVSGTITSTTSVSSYGDFTLITDLAPILNPLPVKLVDFTATKINSSTSSVTWELAACCSGTAKFELEKSTDGRNYFTIITVPGSETNRFYSVQDNGLNNGITYYRLRIKDADGKSIRSRIVAVINNTDGLLITSLWPNPVQSNASFTITAATAGKVMLSIYDLSGKQISEWQAAVTGGNNTIQLFTDRLAKGTYHIIAKNGTARSVLRFIKH
jgi:trimeric autotransporter adhesin